MPPPAAPEKSRAFPPKNFEPPHPRSAQQGDGIWTPFPDGPGGDEPLMVRSVVHPHPASRFLTVTLVAVDLSKLRLSWVTGTDDPKPTGKGGWTPGLVDPAHLPTTRAIFNGGFQAHHGWWGMMRDGHQLVKPRKDACTIALFADGSVKIASWPALADTSMTAFRQTPPCLVEGNEENPALRGATPRAFGGTRGDRKTRRRSAVGLDATRTILFYGMGEEVEPRQLAAGMHHAGAASAAQLDINWNWTRFLVVGTGDDGTDRQITTSLVPNMNHGRREYVKRPTQRDFFYLYEGS